ncbi:MAG TPA: ABC transporter ATP-binding protein, partial [Acetobacteraceae bacterium]|nr:ABC transporter ATP-binding protein [Acetobacteraceae bacterium]
MIHASMRLRVAPLWSAIAGSTSIMPFAAIAEGRKRVEWSEIDWWRLRSLRDPTSPSPRRGDPVLHGVWHGAAEAARNRASQGTPDRHQSGMQSTSVSVHQRDIALTGTPALEIRRLTKRFGAVVAVDAIDLDVRPGEFVTLLGPSGCGKTTTLNLITGFHLPDAGSIRLDGRAVETLAPFRRNLGLVFQDLALFPHMTVTENVGFGLKMRRVSRVEARQRVAAALDMVQLGRLGARRPAQLSGGQRQRVALARALVIRPAMLLLDEPLSSLDLKLREEMRREIAALQQRLGIATVFVTHDQGEALTMSDRVAVMRAGRIEQVGSPSEIYERPASRFVAGFIGNINLIAARVRGPSDADGLAALETGAGPARAPLAPGFEPGPVLLTLRPERLKLCRPGSAPTGAIAWPVRVEQVTYLGARVDVRLRLA